MKNSLVKKLRTVKSLVLAGVLAAASLGAAVPAMADDTNLTATLNVTGITNESWAAATDGSYAAGSTEVYAYPVVQYQTADDGSHSWQYGSDTSNGVEGYVKAAIASGTLSDGAAIGYLYTNLNKGESSMAHDGNGVAVVGGNGTSETPANANVLSLTYENGTWSASNVKPGLYVIAANNRTSSASYSATIVPVNFVYDANGKVTVGDNGVVNAEVKKADEPQLTKNVVDDKGQKFKYGDASIGDTVNFEISVTIPDYGDAWNTENLRYVINDTLSQGLTLNQDSVKVGEQTVDDYFTDEDTNITKTDNTITLDLRHSDVFSHKGSTLVISYSATVNSNAGVNFDEETNTATLQYSTTSNSTDLSTPKKDTTHHYTFGFDTKVNANATTTTKEITKYGVRTTSEENNKVVLQGAEFQLLSGSTVLKFDANGKLDNENGADHITSDAEGQLTATGLDAGTYTLKETKAPDGYSLDPTFYTVVITPYYNADGTLQRYTVQVKGQTGDGITFTHAKLDNGTIENTDNASDADTFAINNTPLSKLPSTGARGVIVLTIAAIAIMAAFGSAFVALKKGGKNKA